MFDSFAKLAVSFITVNTYINACMNSSPVTHCTMHKTGVTVPGFNCYFAIASWFVGAGYILGSIRAQSANKH